MKITLENKYGSIRMSGGGDENVRICSVTGLGIPAYERRCYSSYDFDGVVESVRRVPSRTISVGGDIIGGREVYSKMLKILSYPCEMIIEDKDLRRMIHISSCEMDFVKKGSIYTRFALNMSCDDPYFYDCEDTVAGLYSRKKLISKDTVLPAMFSSRVSCTSIKILSERIVEPVITILGKRNSDNDEGRIEIKNAVTGAVFTLDYVPEDDELVTIDVMNRTITSDIKGNIINCISDDSYISDLVIDERGAEFTTTGYGATGDITATLIYKNKYLEAMV